MGAGSGSGEHAAGPAATTGWVVDTHGGGVGSSCAAGRGGDHVAAQGAVGGSSGWGVISSSANAHASADAVASAADVSGDRERGGGGSARVGEVSVEPVEGAVGPEDGSNDKGGGCRGGTGSIAPSTGADVVDSPL